MAAWFGVGLMTDAYFSAYRLPFAIIAVLNMVAGAALVPMFARMLSEIGSDGKRQANDDLADVGLLQQCLQRLDADRGRSYAGRESSVQPGSRERSIVAWRTKAGRWPSTWGGCCF